MIRIAIFQIKDTDHIRRILVGNGKLLFRILRHDDADFVGHRAVWFKLLNDRFGSNRGKKELVSLDRTPQIGGVLGPLTRLLVGRKTQLECIRRIHGLLILRVQVQPTE
jgi:hypothetical protein